MSSPWWRLPADEPVYILERREQVFLAHKEYKRRSHIIRRRSASQAARRVGSGTWTSPRRRISQRTAKKSKGGNVCHTGTAAKLPALTTLMIDGCQATHTDATDD